MKATCEKCAIKMNSVSNTFFMYSTFLSIHRKMSKSEHIEQKSSEGGVS